MIKKQSKNEARQKRHLRVRKNVSGTPECPRLNVIQKQRQHRSPDH